MSTPALLRLVVVGVGLIVALLVKLHFQLVPINDVGRKVVGFGIEIDFKRIGNTKAASLNFAQVFASCDRNGRIEVFLSHHWLLKLLGDPPSRGGREKHNRPATHEADNYFDVAISLVLASFYVTSLLPPQVQQFLF